MVSDVVIAALIGAIASVIVNLINNKTVREKDAIARAVRDEEIEQRLRNIERKLDTHNGYAKSINEICTNIAVIKTDLANLKEAMKE